jgi:hypothetical protein
MEKIFLAVLADAADIHVTAAVRGILDFIFYAEFERHSEASLKKMFDAWELFHQHKDIFIEKNIRKSFHTIPKLHSMQHYIEAIRSRGTLDGYNTEATERLHIDYAKLGYRASNKWNYTIQMTKWLARREAIHNFEVYLQWAVPGYHAKPIHNDEEEEEEEEAEENEGDEEEHNVNLGADAAGPASSDEDDEIENMGGEEYSHLLLDKLPLYQIAKKPGYGHLLPSSLKEQFGATSFAFHVQNYIMGAFPGRTPPSIPVIEDTYFPTFRRFQRNILPSPEVSSMVTKDPIRATRAEPSRGLKAQVHAWFDTVLVRVPPDTGPNVVASRLLASKTYVCSYTYLLI